MLTSFIHEKGASSQIMMIRPAVFFTNHQTVTSNEFQKTIDGWTTEQITPIVQNEFDRFVELLVAHDIDVKVFEDTLQPITPDAVFPNNWVSFHASGKLFIYPMMALNRRAEKRMDIIDTITNEYVVSDVVDLSFYEHHHKFLEGTGSMVLDRSHKVAYACLSPRTDEEVLEVFGQKAGYRIVTFRAVGGTGQPIYHTNVMMCIGDKFVVLCSESIHSPEERACVHLSLTSTGKQIIEISVEQMNEFAGNMLQLINRKGKTVLVLSKRAFESLTVHQITVLKNLNDVLVTPDLEWIETLGGGSARCMMAEVFLTKKGR